MSLQVLYRTPNYAEWDLIFLGLALNRMVSLGLVCPVPPLSITEDGQKEVEGYLGRSRLSRLLKSGANGQLLERYAARLVEEGLALPSIGEASM